MLLVLWGGLSPQAAACRSPTGGDRTCVFRARSEHAVHIPAPAGMRTEDEPKAAFLPLLRECSQGPRPPPHPARPRCRPQAPPPGLALRCAGPQPERAPPGGGATGGDQAQHLKPMAHSSRLPRLLLRSPAVGCLPFGSENRLLPAPREASNFRALY